MIQRLRSIFSPGYFQVIAYMLQCNEYQVKPYLAWYWRTADFSKVMKRRTLDKTRAATLLILVMTMGAILQIVTAIILIRLATQNADSILLLVGLVLLMAYPIVWAHLVVVPLSLGRAFIIKPRERRLIAQSKIIFAKHPGVIIGVAGSYGKTTMKELLVTVLSEGKKVAATPANKNVAESHARFAASLSGDEDVLVIEYGEGKSGDVAGFAETTRPNIGIITGLAPAHLDQYPSLEAAGQDIFALANYMGDKQIFVNIESKSTEHFLQPSHTPYSQTKVGDWAISDVTVDYEGTGFTMKSGKKHFKLHSKLLGAHQVGPLATVACIAVSLGLSDYQVIRGVSKTTPHEHRMQPYQLNGGWVVDDTYNGNIDGIRAGLSLLAILPAKRKTYITPGLVDQGIETMAVHAEIGKLIASAKPNKVVLMQNSVTATIVKALQSAGFDGELVIETDPLTFYTNLDHFVAAGDLVVMQNDWTDNYS